MDKTQEIANRLWDLMEERAYPPSVVQTVMGALDWSDNPLETALARAYRGGCVITRRSCQSITADYPSIVKMQSVDYKRPKGGS